jgi:tryptophan synthase
MAFIREVFSLRASQKEAVFVGFAMEGFPTHDATASVLLALEAGGADVIELAVPHSDPVADGPTLQTVSQRALAAGASTTSALTSLRAARARGLRAPVVFFGYYNTFRAYGQSFCTDAAGAGADALLCVDLPPEELFAVRAGGLGLVPLITPTTTDERIAAIAAAPNVAFLYCVAVLGVTGARKTVDASLPPYMARVRASAGASRPPLVVGFGISSREAFQDVAKIADGVVVASAMLDACLAVPPESVPTVARDFVSSLTGRSASLGFPDRPLVAATQLMPAVVDRSGPGWYGSFGGAFIPETLRFAVDELSAAFEAARADPAFLAQVRSYDSYVGRPTPLHDCPGLSQPGHARVWLKREDMSHTGAHKINNALGQALLARRIGKRKIIAETGAGQHGVAVATVCAKLGMECIIYMGAVDIQRQSLNVFRMKSMGATIVPVTSGTATLKDAVNEAMRAWVAAVGDTHYIIGSALGPHPFPLICREFQKIIGIEARAQFLALNDKLPDVVVACIGGGSNAIGMFYPFVTDAGVRLLGVEAAGEGIATDKHCAPLSLGSPGVLHGSLSMLMQTADGQIAETHSISAGLDYPGVGPEHAHLRETGRAEYTSASDEEVLRAFEMLCRVEGIIPALESSHAVHSAVQLAATLPADQNVLICLSGRGDKDIFTVAQHMGFVL